MSRVRHEPASCLDLMDAAMRVMSDPAASTAAKLIARATRVALASAWGGHVDQLGREQLASACATLHKVSRL